MARMSIVILISTRHLPKETELNVQYSICKKLTTGLAVYQFLITADKDELEQK